MYNDLEEKLANFPIKEPIIDVLRHCGICCPVVSIVPTQLWHLSKLVATDNT